MWRFTLFSWNEYLENCGTRKCSPFAQNVQILPFQLIWGKGAIKHLQNVSLACFFFLIGCMFVHYNKIITCPLPLLSPMRSESRFRAMYHCKFIWDTYSFYSGGGRYPFWFNSMFKFCWKMIQFNISFNIADQRFNSNDYSIQNKLGWFNSTDTSIQ